MIKMKKLYFLDELEKNRILNLHETKTKNQYLITEAKKFEYGTYKDQPMTWQDYFVQEFLNKNKFSGTYTYENSNSAYNTPLIVLKSDTTTMDINGYNINQDVKNAIGLNAPSKWNFENEKLNFLNKDGKIVGTEYLTHSVPLTAKQNTSGNLGTNTITNTNLTMNTDYTTIGNDYVFNTSFTPEAVKNFRTLLNVQDQSKTLTQNDINVLYDKINLLPNK